jgi:hypothetical protein
MQKSKVALIGAAGIAAAVSAATPGSFKEVEIPNDPIGGRS